MLFGSVTRIFVVLAATAALAQSGQPGTAPGEPILNREAPAPAVRKGPVGSKAVDPQSVAGMREQIGDMESTLSRMRVLLQQMQAKANTSKSPDSIAKANLDMWELMVGHLDKELHQMRVTLAAREDWEARRAALYKQADAKADAAAAQARANQAARFATGTPILPPTEQAIGASAERSGAMQPVPAQASAAPTVNNSASPK